MDSHTHTERHFLILMMDVKLKSNGLFEFFGIIRVYQNGVMMSFTLIPLSTGGIYPSDRENFNFVISLCVIHG